MYFSDDGELKSKVVSRARVKSESHDTSVSVRCDGRTVELGGNIGRFGRADNIFNYSVWQCVERANVLLALLGLPPFTVGEHRIASSRRGVKDDRLIVSNTGAEFSRVDLTGNGSAQSPAKLEQLLNWACGQQVARLKPHPYANGVTWGNGSRWLYAKLYDKARELVKHSKGGASPWLAWAAERAVYRFEIELKQKWLAEKGLQYLDQWMPGMKTEGRVLALYSDFLERGSVPADQYQLIPGRAGEIALSWRAGVDVWKRLGERARYKYRKQLLAYGIDIKRPCAVSRLPVHVEVVELSAVERPEDYPLPDAHLLRLK